MNSPQQPTGYLGQTYALEFTVNGDLDGTTVSPTVDNSPPTGIGNSDPQQLYRRTVEALGLIDPDYTPPQNEDARRGVRGNRLIAFLWISGGSPGAGDASADIVDAVTGVTVQRNIGTFVGNTTFFVRGIFLPQGSMIRVRGMSGSVASPIKVRLHVQFLDNAEDIAKALEAACCLEAAAPNQVIGTTSVNLAVNASAIVTPPVYATLMTGTITTQLTSSILDLTWTGSLFHTGASAANGAMNVRFRVDGSLLVTGSGTTVNTVMSRIMPLAWQRRLPVTAGLHTIDVEWSLFGAVGNTISILAAALPDLFHAHLTMQEQRT